MRLIQLLLLILDLGITVVVKLVFYFEVLVESTVQAGVTAGRGAEEIEQGWTGLDGWRGAGGELRKAEEL